MQTFCQTEDFPVFQSVYLDKPLKYCGFATRIPTEPQEGPVDFLLETTKNYRNHGCSFCPASFF